MNTTLSHDQVSARLASHPLFAHMGPEALAALSQMVRIRTYRRGMRIVSLETASPALHLLTVGRARIAMASDDGHELALDYLEAPAYFGETTLVGGHPLAADVVAVSDAEVFTIESGDLERAIRLEPSLATAIIGTLARRLKGMANRLEGMAFHDARHRIMRVLFNVASANMESRGVADARGMTHYDIATLAGTSRETASRVISSLAKAGVVETHGRTIVVDIPRLAAELTRQH